MILVRRIKGSFRDKVASEQGLNKQVEWGLAELGGRFQALGQGGQSRWAEWAEWSRGLSWGSEGGTQGGVDERQTWPIMRTLLSGVSCIHRK